MTILFYIIMLLSPAFADDVPDDSDKNVVYKQKTEIDFEELEIEGTLVKPESALVVERKAASFNPLIKIRKDWNSEITQSTDEIK